MAGTNGSLFNTFALMFCFLTPAPEALTMHPPATNGMACSADSGDITVMLILDRSASMGDEDKIIHARNTAVTFLGFLRPGDGAGMVSFNHTIRTDIPFGIAGEGAWIADAQAVVDTIQASGATSIGGGIERALLELSNQRVGCLHNLVLLSDGKENVAPFAAEVVSALPARTSIHTVGLGFDSDGELLNAIAARTQGLYFFAPTAEDLQHLYMILRGAFSGMQVAAEVTDVIASGATQAHLAAIDMSASFATFSITSNKGRLDFAIQRPDGEIVSPEYALAEPSVVYARHPSYVFYSIEDPQPGEWRLLVSCDRASGVVKYSALVQVTSSLQADLRVDAASYAAGDPMLLTMTLHDGGVALRNAEATAEIEVPPSPAASLPLQTEDLEQAAATEAAGTNWTRGHFRIEGHADRRSIRLYDDGKHGDGNQADGVYGNYFRDTLNEGSYSISAHTNGIGVAGGRFSRSSTASTFVTASRAPAIVAISPDSAMQGDTVTLSMKGGNLGPDCEIIFGGSGTSVSNTTFNSAERLDATITVATDAPPGLRDLSIRDQHGLSGHSPAIFTIVAVPQHLALLQNYPNPFNATTTIRYHLPEATRATLVVLNILGQEINTLVDRWQPAGYKSVIWQGENKNGHVVPSGVYFYRLSTPNFVQTKKTVLLK